MRRHRRLWIVLGTCLFGFPLGLYVALPSIASLALQYFLSRQGYQQVTSQLGYPGWHTLHISRLTFHQDMGPESLSVTLNNIRLDYDLPTLLVGRLQRLSIADAAVEWRRRGSAPCGDPDTTTAGPGILGQLTAGHAIQRLPELPWHDLVLARGRVFRECATGPLREVVLSGAVQQRAAALDGAVTLQGQEGTAYRLEFTSAGGRDLEAILHAEPAAPNPIVTVQAHVQPVSAGIEFTGTAALDFSQLAPFLAVVLPFGAEIHTLDGRMQAQWRGTAPATVPLATAWQHPETFVSGAISLTLQLPKASSRGEPFSMAMQAEVAGKAADGTYRCAGVIKGSPVAQEARWDVHGTLAAEAQHVWGTLAASTSVEIHQGHFGDVVLPAGTVRLLEPLPFRVNWAPLAWAAAPLRLDIQAPSLSWQEARLLVKQATLSLDTLHGGPAGWQTAGGLTVSGQYEDITVEDLSARLTLQATGATLRVPEPVRVSLAVLQAGIEVRDIVLALQPVWEPPAALAWMELRDLQAAVLGGHLKSPGLRYVPNQPQHTLAVSVEHLDLQQLLQLEQRQSLEGTGVLDGMLPVILTSTGVRVQDGRLEARPPGGTLRYHSTPEANRMGALSEAQLAFVMQALGNVHYNVLTLGVQYAEDGTLNLAVRLEGKNPDWQQGRPIQLNLNLQENVPALLQSLQLIHGEGIQQSIYEQLQQ